MKKPFVFLWVFAGGILLFFWVYLPSLSKYHDLEMQNEEMEKQIQTLTQETKELHEERDLLKHDPEYLEKVIRGELGLVKPGEIVYKFVKDKPQPSPAPTPSAEISPSPVPSASPSPSGETFEARPVETAAVSPAPVVKKKTLPPSDEEPVYPRRETR